MFGDLEPIYSWKVGASEWPKALPERHESYLIKNVARHAGDGNFVALRLILERQSPFFAVMSASSVFARCSKPISD